MKVGIASALLVLFISVNLFNSPPVVSQRTVLNSPKIFFYGRGVPQLITVLRDLPSAMDEGVDVSVYLRGGRPIAIAFKESATLITLGLGIEIDNVSLEELKLSSFMLELGGFYSKATYYVSGSQITIYTTPFYSAKSVYTSVCPTTSDPVTTVEFVVNLNTSYVLFNASENRVVIETRGNEVTVSVMPNIKTLHTTNTSIEIEVLVSSGSCANIVISFDKSVEITEDAVVRFIDYTARVFSKLFTEYPTIQTTSYEVSSLYALSLFNTINMLSSEGLEDIFIGMFPTEVVSYLYLSTLMNASTSCYYPYSRPSSIDEAYANAVALYLHLARAECSEVIDVQRLLDVLKVLINASTSSSSLELAKTRRALSIIELVATLRGHPDVASQARAYRSLVEEILRNLYIGVRYSIKAGEDVLSYENVIEASAIPAYNVPNSEDHMYSVANFLSRVDVQKIRIPREVITDAIEALAYYGYSAQALKLISAYFKSVLYDGVPCADFYRAVLRGFLGIDVALEGVSLAPQLPLVLANTTLTIGKMSVSYVNWGSEIDSMYVDGFLHTQPVISWRRWFGSNSITVVMRRKPLFEMCIGVMRAGAPIANETIFTFSSSGFSSIGITNSSGCFCTLVPCGDRWVHIIIENVSVSLGLESFSCKSSYLVIDLAKEQRSESDTAARIENIIKRLNALNSSISQLLLSMQSTQAELQNLGQSLSSVAEQVRSAHTTQSFLNRITYIAICVATLSLALSLLALWRRK
uniref:Uncharacterized protein n=1 Tax=Ignisphaera aggregans TaxID=334771 RepID=A0A7C4BBC5_9CREN